MVGFPLLVGTTSLEHFSEILQVKQQIGPFAIIAVAGENSHLSWRHTVVVFGRARGCAESW